MPLDLARITAAAQELGREAADNRDDPPAWALDTHSPVLLRRATAQAWWRGWWEDRDPPATPPAPPAAAPEDVMGQSAKASG